MRGDALAQFEQRLRVFEHARIGAVDFGERLAFLLQVLGGEQAVDERSMRVTQRLVVGDVRPADCVDLGLQ